MDVLCRRSMLGALTAFAAAGAGGPYLLGQALAAPTEAQPPDPSAIALARAYNASASDLYAALSQAPGNIVLSPYSIGTAMAMALVGARGETAREMSNALRHTLNLDAILSAHARLAEAVVRSGDAGGGAGAGEAARLVMANALFITSKADIVSKDYSATIAEKFGGEVFAGAGLEAVNAFVKEKTEGKIDHILKSLSPTSAAVLVNAIYFKAAWAEPFSTAQTSDGEFRLASGDVIATPTMRRTGRYAAIGRDGYRAIRLPYADERLAMMIVVPEDMANLERVATTLKADALTTLARDTAAQAPAQIALSLPRFKAQYETDLVPPFRQAGISLAFDDTRADFSGITGKPDVPMAIGQIKHRAMIDVTEEGSEAAAATAVEVLVRSTPLRPTEFKVDRPFLFYVMESATGLVAFSGRITDPR